jgi:hypothetical protein
MHIARCYRLIDMGTQPKMYQGQPKGEARKIRAVFELLGEDRMEDGKPFVMSKSWVLSMHEKSALRRDLESWRGKAFNAEEEAGFDVLKLLGQYCILNVTEEPGADGNMRTDIKGINPMMKGMVRPEGVNPAVLFDADDPDMELFETFSDKLKETIRACREWRIKASGSRASTTASKAPSPASAPVMEDEDCPF